MNEQIKLTKSQQTKVDYIVNLINNCHGKYNDNYEIRDLEISYLSEEIKDVIQLYFVDVYKTHETSVFGSHIKVFITRRGKVTYCDHEDEHKIKTFRGSNAYTLICAGH